ncbi:S41 family peptidase [Plebeiibacterium marinum]|uniref:Tricorn protease homolog n=1 Tax=Plebeiibacterium marinum TaxID=2992111 RepID=A0AAE3MG49_9BACT|nr:S41 family peptidase [Plebeiobacterium marinum]MCW3807101.1 PDZ domain-containing protein [Plebeiobacterium marinum]
MKKLFLLCVVLLLSYSVFGQINAKLMRYMDVSKTQITFVYGGDIWLVDKTGGTAVQITHSPGEESWPKFSPDGKEIAYTANYNGNSDIYVIPVKGGIPTRVTYHGFYDRMVEWHPNGKQLLFASSREGGQARTNQFFLINKNGGLPQKIAIPYGELADFSADGKKLAYITKITENYPFKRYRGGLTSDIIVYDFTSNKTERITTNEANDGKPAWVGDKIYFLSDRGKNMRLNIWEYNPASKSKTQVTNYKDYDISFLSGNSNELVYEMGGDLFLMDTQTKSPQKIDINVISDLSIEMPITQKVSGNIVSATASPGGKRIVFEARGELFDVPVKDGFTLNLTRSSGAFDHSPSWSPDGKHIAYWSDKSGEYEIYLQDTQKQSEAKKLTKRGKGFGYQLLWSPNSKKLAFVDETNNIYITDVKTGETTIADNYRWNLGHWTRFNYPIAWSPDSEWITYSIGQDNANGAIFIYNINSKTRYKVTSGFYNDYNPVFSTDGKYLFYLTDRSMNAAYSSLGDGTWIYPNSTQIASLALKKDTPLIMKTKNDKVDIKGDKKKEHDKKDEDTEENGDNGDNGKNGKSKNDKEDKEKDKIKVEIDFINIEARMEILPPKAGNISKIIPFADNIVYLKRANTGSEKNGSSLNVFDLKKHEDKNVMDDVRMADATADGKSLLVSSKGKYGIIKPAPNQKIEKPIPTDGLTMNLVRKEEWKQIFTDTWRRHRDFFYDPNMHGLNWKEVHDRYAKLVDDARTRWDISNIQKNMVSELSAGHTYAGGGDAERSPSMGNGFLGIDWAIDGNLYKIKRIVKPAEWDTQTRSPFDKPGIKVSAGDYIHSVNGVVLDINKDPYAAFEGLSGKTVLLKISSSGKEAEAEDVVVQCLSGRDEYNLRYLEWIENNRKMVDQLSNGQLGYIYMANTGGQGQQELVRMFYGQLDKKGFILDERWNGGGQLADRFLELIQRPVNCHLHWRHGKDHRSPVKTNTGPIGMLINGWAGSGGDGLPWAFQELKAGPIVGERTLGILVGPATGHRLIDGGSITVPGARLYDNDGHWFWEGEGVRPDFKVWDDPNILMQGRDPQMEKVVEEVMKLTKENKHLITPAPPLEDRTAKGLND